jgi:hypothetical protein
MRSIRYYKYRSYYKYSCSVGVPYPFVVVHPKKIITLYNPTWHEKTEDPFSQEQVFLSEFSRGFWVEITREELLSGFINTYVNIT